MRSTPNSSAIRRRCCVTLSKVVTSGKSPGVFDGDELRPLVNMLGMTMKWRLGSRECSGVTSHSMSV